MSRQVGGTNKSRAWLGLAGVGIAFAGAPAQAQEIKLTGPLAGAPAASASSSPNPGSKMTDDFLLPSGQLEVGGEIVLLTSDEPDRKLELTDVGLLRLRARRAIGDFVELFVGTELLVKEPEAWDEPIWQSAHGGLLVPFGHRLAMSLQGAGGELFEEPGLWWQVQSSLMAKPAIGRWARFELGLGHSITKLDIDEDSRPFWIEEVVAHAETQLGEREFAAWLGVDYSLPVASGPDAPSRTSARFLDPNVGLNLHIGGVISPRKSNWDLFAIYSVMDRGDLERPETTLPILDGGFDQRQLAIGVQHRFGAESPDDE
jgi:hypothetical protein